MTRRPAMPAALRNKVLDSGNCHYCGDLNATQVDHVQPYSRGGTNDRDNLVPACQFCNWEKLDFTPEEWQAWRVEMGMAWPPPSLTSVIKSLLDHASIEELTPWSDLMLAHEDRAHDYLKDLVRRTRKGTSRGERGEARALVASFPPVEKAAA